MERCPMKIDLLINASYLELFLKMFPKVMLMFPNADISQSTSNVKQLS